MGNDSSSTAPVSAPPPVQQGSVGAPGAFSVPGSQRRQAQFYVTVPAGVHPGQEFPVIANGQQLMVRCPPGIRPGERIVVSAPRSHGTTQAYMATVPHGVRPGDQFPVMVSNQQLMVTCPPGVRPGMQVRIMVPSGGRQRAQAPPDTAQTSQSPFGNQMFEVNVPQGVRPAQAFALIANGQRVMVTCPPNARPGQKIRFQLPIKLSADEIRSIKLNYEKDGWSRCLSTDLNFHWVRTEVEVHEDKDDALITLSLAFVRELKPAPAGEYGFTLCFVPAEDVTISTTVSQINNGASLAQELSRYAGMPFQNKEAWFRQQVAKIQVPWEDGHIKINVRRGHLLEDSMEAIESINSKDMRKIFRFEFINEPGVDAGGVAREWFQLVSDSLFNPDFALWQYSAVNQMCMQINSASGVANDEHLRYFHFAGRLLGKALFDRQIVSGHLVRPLYKHLLSWPVMLSDLEHLDTDTYSSLKKLLKLEDVECCCLDFTVTENVLGEVRSILLKPDGDQIDVTNANLNEYIELQLKYRLLGRINEQVKALLVGFYDVIPEALLSVFDFQEIELLLCGLPEIDMNDWKENSEYTGEFERAGVKHKIVKWFWEVVDDFDQELKARLLQFVTGTSGVPAQGFKFLQGNDGNIRKFTVNSIPESVSMFPKAHTCFNRIDLPTYTDKKKLCKFVTMAVQMEATGFDID